MRKFLTVLAVTVGLALGVVVPAEAQTVLPSCNTGPVRIENSLGQFRGSVTGSCNPNAVRVTLTVYETYRGATKVIDTASCTAPFPRSCTARSRWITKLEGSRYRVASVVQAN